MKKSISLILVFLLLFALGACNTPVEDDPPEEPFVGEELQIVTYYERVTPKSLHIRTKTLSDEWTQGLIQALIQAPETGETADKISNEEVTKYAESLPIPSGTRWFITGNIMFRLMDDKLYRVNRHLGEGREVEYSDALKEMVLNACYYAPYNSYRGTWKNGTLEVEHVFENKSTVDITVEEITRISERRYKAKVTLYSTRTQTVEFWYRSQQSEDNFGSTEETEIQLRKGKKETIEIEFYGFNYGFYIQLRADNTHAQITIKPE